MSDCTWLLCVTVTLRDPSNNLALIEGLVFRASYLGSTQLNSDHYQQHTQTSKATRMMQAQEAVGRIKVIYWVSCQLPTFLYLLDPQILFIDCLFLSLYLYAVSLISFLVCGVAHCSSPLQGTPRALVVWWYRLVGLHLSWALVVS